MEATGFLKPHVLLQCLQYSHVDMHVTAQLMSGCPGRESRRLFTCSVLSFQTQTSREALYCNQTTWEKHVEASQSRTLETLLFSRQLLHHTMRCAALAMTGLRLLLLVEMWWSCTTTKYAGIKIPVLFVSWGTFSPITEKLAASSCAELRAQPGKGQACQGVCCLSKENGTLWSVAGVDLWLLSAASPYYRPSSSPKLFLPFVFLLWADVPYSLSSIDKWVSRNRNIELDELF